MKKRINNELFIDRMAAIYMYNKRDGSIKGINKWDYLVGGKSILGAEKV